jgi:hypothetical protein
MKKVLLFAILALSINAFAQSNQPALHPKRSTLNSKGNADVRMMDVLSKKSGMNLFQSIQFPMETELSLFQKMDSVYTWNWDPISTGWKLKSKTTQITYNTSNYVISFIEQTLDGSEWVDTLQYAYTYNAHNDVLTLTVQRWSGYAWVNTIQQVQTFDVNFNRTSYAYQNWNGSAWVDYSKTISTYVNDNLTSTVGQSNGVNTSKYMWEYDLQNNRKSEVSQKWNAGNWENKTKSIFIYDLNNNIVSDTGKIWNSTTSVWESKSVHIYTYNSKNKKLSETDYYWNIYGGIGQWENSSKVTFTYDINDNITERISATWDGSNWHDSSRQTYTYDPNNNQTGELDADYDGTQWVNSWRAIYTYDAKNNTTSTLNQNWNGSSWVNSYLDLTAYDANSFEKANSYKFWYDDGTQVEIEGDSTFYFYQTVVVGINDFLEAGLSVYPNPTHGRFTISSKSAVSAIEIYNLSGERVYSQYNFSQQTSKEIDLSGSAKGIYLVKINNGTKSYNRKIVVQ